MKQGKGKKKNQLSYLSSLFLLFFFFGSVSLIECKGLFDILHEFIEL